VDGISTRCGWEVVFAETADQARHLSGQLNPAIILLDRDVAGGDWRHAVSSLSSSSAGTCVLLISKVADEYLWNEVVSYGGYDLIPKPLSEKDLCRAIKLAWSYWNGRRSATLVKK
jgi:DNA-binding response OmpR family regulator